MTDELLNKFLEKSLKYLNNIEDFGVRELPIYMKELLEYKFLEHIVNWIIGSFAFAMAMFLCTVLLASLVLIEGALEKSDIRKYSIVSFVTILFSTFILNNGELLKAYKIKVAPRVYMVDYIRGTKQ